MSTCEGAKPNFVRPRHIRPIRPHNRVRELQVGDSQSDSSPEPSVLLLAATWADLAIFRNPRVARRLPRI